MPALGVSGACHRPTVSHAGAQVTGRYRLIVAVLFEVLPTLR